MVMSFQSIRVSKVLVLDSKVLNLDLCISFGSRRKRFAEYKTW